MSAIPVPDPRRQRGRAAIVLQGECRGPTAAPGGCPFHTRCPLVADVCRRLTPVLEESAPRTRHRAIFAPDLARRDERGSGRGRGRGNGGASGSSASRRP